MLSNSKIAKILLKIRLLLFLRQYFQLKKLPLTPPLKKGGKEILFRPATIIGMRGDIRVRNSDL